VRILVAVDFSAASRLACRWAIEHLNRLEVTEVFFHHVVEEEGLPAIEKGVSKVRAFVDEAYADEDVPSTVGLRYAVTKGRPAESILAAARSNRCQTIVMGTNGRRGMNRLLLGSVAEVVVRTAPCTVVVVKPDSA